MEEKLVELIRYNNIAEQKKIELLLKYNKIEYLNRTFEDLAYDGLYTMYHGLGQIVVFKKDYERAKKIIDNELNK